MVPSLNTTWTYKRVLGTDCRAHFREIVGLMRPLPICSTLNACLRGSFRSPSARFFPSARSASLAAKFPLSASTTYNGAYLTTEMPVDYRMPRNEAESKAVVEHCEAPARKHEGAAMYTRHPDA